MPGTKGSGGRNRLSSQQHQLHGTFRTDRHGDGENPDPPKGTPAPPAPLAGDALAEWDRMVARLEQSQTLSLVDDAVLYQYVQLFAETEDIKADHARVRELSADLKKAVQSLEGVELVKAVGEIVKLQQVLAKQRTQLRQGHMAIRQFLVEFGLTTASRSRVKVIGDNNPKPQSALEKLSAQRAQLRAVK